VNPKVMVLLAGTNNVPNGNAEDISRGLTKVVNVMRAKAPNATLIITAIFPRNDNANAMPIINRVNEDLAKLADGKKLRFLNVNAKLADASGTLLPGMMNADKLHPALPGYQLWADGLRPILTELLGPAAATDHAPAATGDPSAKR
jgi:lysophospholipase L1-like esterase